MVNCPSVNGNARLSTYGMAEIGDEPRSARVMTLTASELMNNPTKKTAYRFAFNELSPS